MKTTAAPLAGGFSWRLAATLGLHGAAAVAAGFIGWTKVVRPPAKPAEPIVMTIRAPAGKKAPPAGPVETAPVPVPPPQPAPPAPLPPAPPVAQAAPVSPPVVTTPAKTSSPARPAPPSQKTTAAAKKKRSSAEPPAKSSGRGEGKPQAGGKGSGGTAGDGDGGAVLVSSRTPPYPAAAKAARRQGTVTVRVTVDSAGRVIGSRLYKSCGTGDLDAAAVSAVTSWKFRPAHRGGRAVTSDALVQVRFTLR